MGRRKPSRAKRVESPRDPTTYLPEVERRLRLLKAAALRWDSSDNDDDVVTMAVCLRTLLGDGDRLLDRVVSMKRSLFFDSPPELPARHDGGAWMGVGGLAVMMMGPEATRSVVPLCHIPNFAPPERYLRFREWWDVQTPVCHDANAWTRRFVVQEVANTDGVHVATHLDDDYVRLSGPLQNVTMTRAGETTQRPVTGVMPAAIRQIAWEVDRTITALLASERLARIRAGPAPASND
jgi:hypothetical protein